MRSLVDRHLYTLSHTHIYTHKHIHMHTHTHTYTHLKADDRKSCYLKEFCKYQGQHEHAHISLYEAITKVREKKGTTRDKGHPLFICYILTLHCAVGITSVFLKKCDTLGILRTKTDPTLARIVSRLGFAGLRTDNFHYK